MHSTSPPDPNCTEQSERRVVAASAVVTVEACDCGVVHLHFGPLSMRFTSASIDQLYRTLGRARTQLSTDQDPREELLTHHFGRTRGIA